MSDPREQLILELDRARHGAAAVGPDAVLVRSPTCGDEVRIEVDVADGMITAVGWAGRGCTVSMASTSALAVLAPGLQVAGFASLHETFRRVVRGPILDPFAFDGHPLGDALAFAGIGRLPLRAGCADLAWAALAEALEIAGRAQEADVEGPSTSSPPPRSEQST